MSSNIGIGEVKTSLTSVDHTQLNCGVGLYDKDKVYYMPDAIDGKVIVDGKKCTVLSKDGYDNNAVLTLGDKTYDVVKMPDGKYWLAQNLDWLPDGVTLVTSSDQAPSAPAACYYNLSDNGKGLLYNGYALETINQLVPDGWRLPHSSDYENLFASIGGNTVTNIKKIRSTSGWSSIQGTDNYGLNIYPNGYRNSSKFFVYPEYAYLYTDTKNGELGYRVKIEQNAVADFFTAAKTVYYSVRLVKD